VKSPIVFQSLEEELKPILRYVRGVVPNAGCGERVCLAKILSAFDFNRMRRCVPQSGCDITIA
jgi:hypothetical protein